MTQTCPPHCIARLTRLDSVGTPCWHVHLHTNMDHMIRVSSFLRRVRRHHHSMKDAGSFAVVVENQGDHVVRGASQLLRRPVPSKAMQIDTRDCRIMGLSRPKERKRKQPSIPTCVTYSVRTLPTPVLYECKTTDQQSSSILLRGKPCCRMAVWRVRRLRARRRNGAISLSMASSTRNLKSQGQSRLRLTTMRLTRPVPPNNTQRGPPRLSSTTFDLYHQSSRQC